ncbi:MAG: ATP-dependent helicase HrpB [Spongiibacteraceae bacterium]
MVTPSELPIHQVLAEVHVALQQRHEIVLEAPPGAGKTTVVPLSLLEQPWLLDQKILLLEPRRIAARAAAERMSQLLGEGVGETVGYRMRLENRIGPTTRVEVVTEGILIRMLQDDPSLSGYGAVIFDEFHERSLDADLGLALTIEGRSLFADEREQPLKIIVMSATLDGQRIAALLNDAPVISSQGKQYSVDIVYGDAYRFKEDIAINVAATVRLALQQHEGSVLVFLPGQREIRNVARRLSQLISDPDVLIAPLYGDLSLQAQRSAIQPCERGRRKIVLATSIAESSLTIDGISVVVDSGLTRQPVFDPSTGMTRLATCRVSKASATQRAGRAGRLNSGVCYRLWAQSQQAELIEFAPAEIHQAELSGLALQLLSWGGADPSRLCWLDQPPAAAFQQSLDLLQRLGATKFNNGDWHISRHGQSMAELPMHPRLAHMLLRAKQFGRAKEACEIAALLSERDVGTGKSSDISERVSLLRSPERADNRQRGMLNRLQQLQRRYQSQLAKVEVDQIGESAPADPGLLLALAYPERIAKQRREHGQDYLLCSGRGVRCQHGDPMVNNPWIVAAVVSGEQGEAIDIVRVAAPLDSSYFEQFLAAEVSEKLITEWDQRSERFVAERHRRVGALLWQSERLASIPESEKTAVILEFVAGRGLEVFDWTPAALQFQARIEMLRELDDGNSWPDFSDRGLLSNLSEWLAPYIAGVSLLRDFKRLNILEMLSARLNWEQLQRLESLAPSRIKVPSGSTHKIDYCQSPPVLAVKLQEMFSCAESPRVAGGKQALCVHLLSPAGRPLQVTQDLAGFWTGSYHEVKKEMKGRYPKHPWPDNPLDALPTARAKPRR